MREYHYPGPASGATPSDGTEALLWSGKTVSLPEEHDYVKVLAALKHLVPEPEDVKSAVIPAVQPSRHRSSSDSRVKTGDAYGS